MDLSSLVTGISYPPVTRQALREAPLDLGGGAGLITDPTDVMNHIMACVERNNPELLEKPKKKQKDKTETVAPVEEKKNKPIDDIEEDWEPDDEEIEEFAVWLGMDKDKDKDLFYIAKEGASGKLCPEYFCIPLTSVECEVNNIQACICRSGNAFDDVSMMNERLYCSLTITWSTNSLGKYAFSL